MAEVSDRPNEEAVYKTAEFIAAYVRAAAPTAKSAASFRITHRLGVAYIRSKDMGTVQTETNGRHPVYARGPRDNWAWRDQNKNHPERTGFMERAAELAADEAAQLYLDAWIDGVVAESPRLTRG